MDEVVMEQREVLNNFLYETIYEIEDLTIPHEIKRFKIEEAKVKEVKDKKVLIKATGTVTVRLESGAYGEDQDDEGYDMDGEFAFDATFTAPLAAFWDEVVPTSVIFNVNTNNAI